MPRYAAASLTRSCGHAFEGERMSEQHTQAPAVVVADTSITVTCDRKSPPQASGLQSRSSGGLGGLQPVLVRLRGRTRVRTAARCGALSARPGTSTAALPPARLGSGRPLAYSRSALAGVR